MRDQPLVRAAEVGLLAVTLAAVVGMSRLFDGGGWLAPLAVSAMAGHAMAAVLRRLGLSLGVTAILMTVGAALVTTWMSYWSTTVLGIPTADTWSAVRVDLDSAWVLYQDVVAPAPVETGFIVVSSLAIWCVAYIADWAAFRLWVPFEATLPAGTLFLFTALLGADGGRMRSVGVYAAALLAFLLLHRLTRQDNTSYWVAENRPAGHRFMLRAGTALGVLAVAAGSVIGPSLPGADSPGVFDPREINDHDDPRVTISPLVDIRSRLVDQSAVEVFQVRATRPAYWRLTSLERFDGRIWSSSGSYGKADSHLPEAVDLDIPTEGIEQSFSIGALAAIWLPGAYEPRSFDGPGLDVRYDEDSATLIVDNSLPSSDGLQYRVESESPRPTAQDLEGAGNDVPRQINERFTGLPVDFSPEVGRLALDLTASANGPYAKALALQNHLRTFSYDLNVDSGHSTNDLERFLFETRRGYCEQFAGAFAAMARVVGLAARVAVGFTPGEPDPAEPGLYRVKGEHAHAWPEVFLAGAGWVAFEPTPGRGIPAAEGYTGVPESQVAPGDPTTATTRSTAPAPGSAGSSETTVPSEPGPAPVEGSSESGDSGADAGDSLIQRYGVDPASRVAPWVLGAVALYALAVPLALQMHRRRRRARAKTVNDRIALAWREAAEEAALVGFTERPSETFPERSANLILALPPADGAATALVRALEVAQYSAGGAGPTDAKAATEAAIRIGGLVHQAATRRALIRRWFDPRPQLRAWWRGRRLARRTITPMATHDRTPAGDPIGTGRRG